MFPPPKNIPPALTGADHRLPTVTETSERSPVGDAPADIAASTAALPAAEAAPPPTCSANDVFGQWGVTGQGTAGQVRYLVARHLREAPADLPLSTVAPSGEHAPGVHLVWHRLQRSGVSRLVDDWRAAMDLPPALRDAAGASRLCRLMDRVMETDPIAALAAIHGTSPPGGSMTARLEKLEEVLAFAHANPEPHPRQPSEGASTAVRGEGVRRTLSTRSAESIEANMPRTPPTSANPLARALAPHALRPQISMLSQSSADSFPLNSLDLSQFQAPAPREGTLFDELVTPSSAVAAPSSASSGSLQGWDWPSGSDTGSDLSDGHSAGLPSLGSLAWLSSMRTRSEASQSPWPGDFSADVPSMEDLESGRQILSFGACPGLSAADELQREWALTLSTSYLDGNQQLPFMSREEATSIAWIVATMTRRMMALPQEGSEDADLSRPPAATAALDTLAAWVARSSGAEGVRRERWLQYLTDRSFDPEAKLQLAAPLLAQGLELPPREALDALLPPDSLSDRGTLRWHGQPLLRTPALGELLDRLGVRHLDVRAALQLSSQALLPLRNADVQVVTLNGTRSMTPAALRERIAELEQALPSLYRLRIADQRGGIERAALPPGWIPDPHASGQLRHLRRDANRKRMTPLRDLWPVGRMPPALRARAMNVLPDGEPVLEFIGRLHRQRSAAGQPGARDVELCAHLGVVLEGLAEDADFARRCRKLAESPAGPCADGGTLTLSAMSALRDAAEATSIREVAENAFLQSCLARASAARAERRPDFEETLEEAMVLRWHVAGVLAELLGSRCIRAADKPVFGAYVEGRDWNSPAKREAFRNEALALVTAEVEDDFPGVVMLMSAQEDPLAATFQSRIDQEPSFKTFDLKRAAARLAFDDADTMDAGALAHTAGELQRIDEAQHTARFAALRSDLDAIRDQVRAAAGRPAAEPRTAIAP